MRVLKSKKGITLIEVILGMLIFTFIVISITSILIPVLKTYSRANDLAKVNTLFDNLYTKMLSDLWGASEIIVSNSGKRLELRFNTENPIYYTIPNDTHAEELLYNNATPDNVCTGGLLYKNDMPVLDEMYYGGKTICVKYFSEDGLTELEDGIVSSAFIIRITIFSNGYNWVSRDYAINPLGLQD